MLLEMDENNLAFERLVMISFPLDDRFVVDDISFYFDDVDWNVVLMMRTLEKLMVMLVFYDDAQY